jgi:signal peptidase I
MASESPEGETMDVPQQRVEMPPFWLSLVAVIITLVGGVAGFGVLLDLHDAIPAWSLLGVTLVLVWAEQRVLPGLRERSALRRARAEGKRLVKAVRAASKKQKHWTGTDTEKRLEALCVETLTATEGAGLETLQEAIHKLDELADKALTRKPVYREYIEQIGGALLAAFILRAFFYEAFRIPSASMEPTLLVGDHLFVNKFVYGIRVPFSLTKFFVKAPNRGDIVVFNRPGDESGDDIIKRVIGLPGDHVEVHDRHVSINGVPLETHRLAAAELNKSGDTRQMSDEGPFRIYQQFEEKIGTHTHVAMETPAAYQGSSAEGSWVVEPDHVFVMGDNRDDSLDSRFGPDEHGFGQVPLNYIKGRADVIWMSLGGAHGVRFNRLFTLLH